MEFYSALLEILLISHFWHLFILLWELIWVEHFSFFFPFSKLSNIPPISFTFCPHFSLIIIACTCIHIYIPNYTCSVHMTYRWTYIWHVYILRADHLVASSTLLSSVAYDSSFRVEISGASPPLATEHPLVLSLFRSHFSSPEF